MRVGVIGLGSIGRRHVGNLQALGCDVVTWDLALGPYQTAQDFLDCADPDAVVIASPWNQHLEGVEAALAEKLPFFIEKPLGSLEQLPRWRDIAQMDLPINQVGYQCRFHLKLKALRDFVPNPTGGQFVCGCDPVTWPGQSYGPLLLEASHDLDLALHCGAPTDDVWGYPEEIHFGNDSWSVHIRRSAEYFRMWSLGSDPADASVAFRSPEELGTDMYRDELAHFLECVRENKPTSVPLADGLRVLEVVAQVEALCPSSR